MEVRQQSKFSMGNARFALGGTINADSKMMSAIWIFTSLSKDKIRYYLLHEVRRVPNDMQGFALTKDFKLISSGHRWVMFTCSPVDMSFLPCYTFQLHSSSRSLCLSIRSWSFPTLTCSMKPIRTEKVLPLCGTVSSNVDVALRYRQHKIYILRNSLILTFSQDKYVR